MRIPQHEISAAEGVEAEAIPMQKEARDVVAAARENVIASRKDDVAEHRERFGRIDLLVNSAGIGIAGRVEDLPAKHFDLQVAVNLRGLFFLSQAVGQRMIGRRSGTIINIGSVLAYVGEPKLGAYSVSKGGLMTLTKNAASLLNRDRIRVNQINVGWTLTEGERRVKREQEGKSDDWIAQAIATRPFGRLLAPIDIAYAAAYFASDESACVTGSVLDLEQYPPGALANS